MPDTARNAPTIPNTRTSIRFELANGLETKVAVLGPMRMNYARAISAVLHVGQAFKTSVV